MALQAGHELAHYEIAEPIGKGGMGEVYRARDEKLGRDVAIKVLPPEFTEDEERRARFGREAKVLASLNHPNIAAIYGFEESGGTHYLVLELVAGETLAERIARGPIPVDDAIEIAIQIAEALEQAHAHGIVHRDLKPANIKLTPDGNVKVLDFGLAKAFAEETADADSSLSPTITRDSTRVGVILGTAAYMSPEQAKGKSVDARTDVFAFGAVVYEMLTGRKAYPGDDVSEVLASVIKLEPDWSALPALPRRVEETLRRCVDKDPRRRTHAIADARIDLENNRDVRESVEVPVAWKPRWQIAVVFGLLIAAGFAGGWLWPRSSTSGSTERFAIALDPALSLEGTELTFSPDGSELVFTAYRGSNSQLYRRARGDLDPLPVSGTEGAVSAFFSPDGDSIGFYTRAGEIKTMSWPPSGSAHTLDDVAPGFQFRVLRGSWSDDDDIVFTDGYRILRVPATGGTPVPITEPTEDALIQGWPQLLPNGRSVLFTLATGPGTGEIALVSTETKEWRVLHSGIQATFISGYIVYLAQGSLWAIEFDPDAGETRGDAVRMLPDVLRFTVGHDGALAYVDGQFRPARRLLWVSRSGKETPALASTDYFRRPRLSPDGERLAVAIESGVSGGDLWIYDLERGTRVRLTFEDNSTDPVWTPDGQYVTYASLVASIYQRRSDGSGEREVLIEGEGQSYPHSWSPDGRVLAFYVRPSMETQRDISILRVGDDGGEPESFFRTPFNERSPAFSPNGDYVAYASNESGEDEVYVQPFPGPGPKLAVSRSGGREPVWSRDGSELFFRRGGEVWSATVVELAPLAFAEPTLLFDGPYVDAGRASGSQSYDVAPDGRFLMQKHEGGSAGRLVIVLNWVDELKKTYESSP